jgi:DNA-binding GntR family transcriptional regulator
VDSATPASVRVAQAIRADITAGRIQIGDRLPTRSQLMEEHGIAAMTAAKVIKMLTDEGTVQSQPGRGVYVVATPPEPVTPDLPAATALEARLRGMEARIALLEQHIRNHPHQP